MDGSINKETQFENTHTHTTCFHLTEIDRPEVDRIDPATDRGDEERPELADRLWYEAPRRISPGNLDADWRKDPDADRTVEPVVGLEDIVRSGISPSNTSG
mmetsp:Transcript_67976/g.107800  ORF Transcript_67976/g.107800 Transcript_67976/m.107800 type:complete len:101 (-) Transcript_67976:740-1042(-)